MKLLTLIALLVASQYLCARETITIYGKVVSGAGEGISGAIVSLGNSNKNTPTMNDGSFRIQAVPGDSLFIHTGSYHPKIWIVPQTNQNILFPRIVLIEKATAPVLNIDLKNQKKGPVLVMGTVKDAENKILQGASVIIRGTFTGVATNKLGSFNIEAMPGDTLEIRTLGYKTRFFEVDENSDAMFREVLMEIDTTMLDEVKVSPWLTKEMMSYESVPLDASEINRMYLREKAVYTDKSRFRTVSYNFAPLLGQLLGKGIALIVKSKTQKKQDRIDSMRQKVLQELRMKELQQDTIP